MQRPLMAIVSRKIELISPSIHSERYRPPHDFEMPAQAQRSVFLLPR